VYLPEYVILECEGNLSDIGFFWVYNVSITGNNLSIADCNINSLSEGMLRINGINITIDNSTVDMGIQLLGNDISINNSTIYGTSNITKTFVQITGSYFEVLNLYNGSLNMRNTSMDRFWMDGFQLDEIELDVDGSNDVDGRSFGYLTGNTDTHINASEYGYLALVNVTSAPWISGGTNMNILIAYTFGVEINDTTFTSSWTEIMIIESVVNIITSEVYDVVIAESSVSFRSSILNGTVTATDPWQIHFLKSEADSVNLINTTGWFKDSSFDNLYLKGSHMDSFNSTWDDLNLHGNSTVTDMMWFQTTVFENTAKSLPIEDADIEVRNRETDEVFFASPGFGGNDSRTDEKGKSIWIAIPGVVHNDMGSYNQTYNVTVSDEAGGKQKIIRGPGPVIRLSFRLQTHPPSIDVTYMSSEIGLKWFDIVLFDPNWDPVSVGVLYSLDNDTWYNATILNETVELEANDSGVEHILVWDSLFDLPGGEGDVYLSFTPSDQSREGDANLTSVYIDNTDLPHPPTVELLTPPNEAVINSTSIMFSWQSYDHDNDAYSNRLYLDNGTEVFQVHMMNWSSYTVHNLTENVTYEWWVEVSDGRFDVLSEKRNFTINLSAIDRNPPAIVHTPVTLAHVGVELPIHAYVYDDVGVAKVTLMFGKGSNWSSLEMTGTVLFSVTLPASNVSEDFSYYIIASDGRNAVTSPTGDPYEVIVLAPEDDVSPSIDHTPEVNWTYGEPLTITVDVSDDRFVDYVELMYADPRYILGFTGVEMGRTDGDHMDGTYSAVIPGYAVVPSGVEYWILATDGINNATKGSETNPLNASVVERDRILMTNLSITDGYIEIWASIRGPGNLDVSLTTDPSGGGRDDIGLFFTVEIDSPDANVTWVSIEVHYGDLPAGVKARDLRIFHWDAIDEKWRYAGITGVDVDGGYVWANLTHLTIFAPMEIPDEKDDESLAPFLAIAVVVILAVFLAIVFMRHKHAFKKIREKAGKVTCPRCRSEVDDNVSHRCPECGALLPKGSQEEAWERTKDGPDEEEAEDDGKGLKPLPPMPGTEPKDVGPEFPMGVPHTPETGPDIKDLEDAGHVERYGSMKAPEKGDEPVVRGARPGPERKDDLKGLKDESEPVKTPEWEDDDTPVEEESGDDAPGDADTTPEWEGGEKGGEDVADAPKAPDDDGRKTPEWEEDVEEPSDKDGEQ